MFFGQFEIQIQNDGTLISKAPDERFLSAMLSECKGKTCTVYFDKAHQEIIFSFDNSLYGDEDFTALSSFVAGNDPEIIRKQFRIPKDYLRYYPDETAFIVGLKDAVCISKTESVLSNNDHEMIDLL